MSANVVSASIIISAPPEAVFAILADPRQHVRIDGSGTVRGSVEGPDRLEKGACFGTDMVMFGVPYKVRNTVVEYEDGRLIAWRHFAGHRWRYQLASEASGTDATKVTESFDYSHVPAPQRLLLRLTGFPERNRRGIEQTLVKLKHAAEGDAA